MSGLAGRRDHLIPDRALRRLVARHLRFERLEQATTPLHVVASDRLTGIEVRLSDGSLADAVLAAAAIPGVLPPVRWRPCRRGAQPDSDGHDPRWVMASRPDV
jgi:NTE family protein